MENTIQKKKGFNIYQIAGIGLFAALAFVSNYIQIYIPLGGDTTRIHIGNTFCLLAGLLLGPLAGGLSAGIGNCLYDLLNPLFISSAPFTFIFKFLMAFVCALIAYGAHARGENQVRNIIGAVVGSLTYIILYLGKGFITGLLEGHAMETIWVQTAAKAGASFLNGAIAVVASVPLCFAIRKALERTHLMDKLIRG